MAAQEPGHRVLTDGQRALGALAARWREASAQHCMPRGEALTDWREPGTHRVERGEPERMGLRTLLTEHLARWGVYTWWRETEKEGASTWAHGVRGAPPTLGSGKSIG